MAEKLTIWRNGRFVSDDWVFVGDEDLLPAGRDVVVSARRFQAECADLLQRSNGGLGVRLGPDDAADIIAHCVNKLDLIVLEFPKFADGRGYSKARIIREKHGYAGELRADGDVLIDQIPFMERCGFTSFSVSHEPTRAALEANKLPAIDHFYQPLSETEAVIPGRSWLRRPAEG